MPQLFTRRAALSALAAAGSGLLLAACGSSGSDSSGSDSSGSDSSGAGSDGAGSGGAGSGGAGSGGASSGGTRTVRHARGESTVPQRAVRVVVLDTDALDSVVTLGITPVGATTVSDGAPFSAYLPAARFAGTKPVGVIGQPGLESIAALRPDLILSNQVRDDKRYDELSKIAPTVLTKTTGPAWKENFRLHAEALGRQTEAAAVEAEYQGKVRALVTALGGPEKTAATRVGMARFLAGAPTRLYLNDTFVGSVFRDLGVGRPANQDKPGFSLEISPEQVDQAAADVIFYSVYGDAAKSDHGRITEGALWRSLDAVRNGRVYQVDDNLWMLGIGYTGAGLILAQIRKDLVG
ncbi:ABC transporter substrate-binding protein [Kitasatospora sp. NPDC058170]|uniref:ABC transporter substrate-binding protein n=1 Tax=Kitasatospora sp. NPDC058170 TaxID=3346364 RepID=UPI0036DD1D9F